MPLFDALRLPEQRDAVNRARPRTLPNVPVVVFYSAIDLPRRLVEELTLLMTELGIGRLDVKNLRNACSAMAGAAPTFVLAAEGTIRWWDRDVLDHHAKGKGVPVRWVRPNDDEARILRDVRDWASQALRQRESTRPR